MISSRDFGTSRFVCRTSTGNSQCYFGFSGPSSLQALSLIHIFPESTAGLIPAMLPFGTIFLTPIFGSIYDKFGKGATLMLIGSVLLTIVHVTLALPLNSWIIAIIAMTVLGIAFGLVPSAMWPSVPKIDVYKRQAQC